MEDTFLMNSGTGTNGHDYQMLTTMECMLRCLSSSLSDSEMNGYKFAMELADGHDFDDIAVRIDLNGDRKRWVLVQVKYAIGNNLVVSKGDFLKTTGSAPYSFAKYYFSACRTITSQGGYDVSNFVIHTNRVLSEELFPLFEKEEGSPVSRMLCDNKGELHKFGQLTANQHSDLKHRINLYLFDRILAKMQRKLQQKLDDAVVVQLRANCPRSSSLDCQQLVSFFTGLGIPISELQDLVANVVKEVAGFDAQTRIPFTTFIIYDDFVKTFRLSCNNIDVDGLEADILKVIERIQPNATREVIWRIYCVLHMSFKKWMYDETSVVHFRDVAWLMNEIVKRNY